MPVQVSVPQNAMFIAPKIPEKFRPEEFCLQSFWGVPFRFLEIQISCQIASKLKWSLSTSQQLAAWNHVLYALISSHFMIHLIPIGMFSFCFQYSVLVYDNVPAANFATTTLAYSSRIEFAQVPREPRAVALRGISA